MNFRDAIAFVEQNKGKVTIDETGDEPKVVIIVTTRLYTIKTAGPSIEDAAEAGARIVAELSAKAELAKAEIAAEKAKRAGGR